MGALSPLFFAAAAAVAVPIFIHLFQRQDTRRLAFPALRYLERTERERAREIRLRQLLLLLARVGALLLVVGAGARLFVSGSNTDHPPTAVVIVLDNSMSSGLVVGERRVLDVLKELAQESLQAATPLDRFWVLLAGEPWVPALPGDAAHARTALEAVEPSDARGDLVAALRRARELLLASDLESVEIHLLTDLQATAFAALEELEPSEIPTVVSVLPEPGLQNQALARAIVGGGLPPLEGQRSMVSVAALGALGDTTRLPVRVVLNDRIRAAATVPVGSEASLPLPPSGEGWVRGYADLDPDALRADDRRYFAFRSRPAPRVALAGAPGLFTVEALSVLTAAGRIREGSPADVDLLVSTEGQGLDALHAGGSALVLPPSDPARLPALNRRLAEAGIGWRFEPRGDEGEASLQGSRLPEPLQDVRVRRWYDLRAPGESSAASAAVAEVAGRPWAVEGSDALGRPYILLASPLDETSSTLPVSTGMLRFFDWISSRWSGSAGADPGRLAGDHLRAPASATHVQLPSGRRAEIDGTRTVRGTGKAGFYTFLAGEDEVAVVALNPPSSESALARVALEELEEKLQLRAAGDAAEWKREIFRTRQGPELWWPLLLGALLLLGAETLLGTSGRSSRRVTAPSRLAKDEVDVAA